MSFTGSYTEDEPSVDGHVEFVVVVAVAGLWTPFGTQATDCKFFSFSFSYQPSYISSQEFVIIFVFIAELLAYSLSLSLVRRFSSCTGNNMCIQLS